LARMVRPARRCAGGRAVRRAVSGLAVAADECVAAGLRAAADHVAAVERAEPAEADARRDHAVALLAGGGPGAGVEAVVFEVAVVLSAAAVLHAVCDGRVEGDEIRVLVAPGTWQQLAH